MANTLLTIDMITKEALRILENNLTFTKGVNRQYDSQFANSGAKIGDTLRIRKPPRWTVRDGATLSAQDATDESVSLVLDKQKGVDFQFTSKELALSIDDFAERYLKTAMAAVANKIDYDGLTLYQNVYNAVGTPATPPSALLTFANGKVKMSDDGCPQDNMISAVVGAQVEANLVDAAKALFHAGKELEKQYEEGKMGMFGGMKFSMDQNINTHTVGALGGTPLVDGATQTGASLVTKGWSNSITNVVKVGDIFTIAGVFHVNPQSKISTGVLQQFVVTANASSGASTGPATISISPSIVTSGATQTVSASPADNAALTVLGAGAAVSPQHLIYHRDAFALGCADLDLPRGVDFASRVSSDKVGLSVRIVRAYDIVNDRFPCRIDVLYGWKAIYPQLACRVAG